MALPKLSTIIESDLDSIYDTDEAATSITYTPKATGVGASVPAFISIDGDLAQTDTGLAVLATFYVRKDDVTRPSVYDSITYDSRTWTVQQALSSNKHNWEIIAYSDQRGVPTNMS